MKYFTLSTSEKLKVLELWNQEYPEKLSYENLEKFNEYLSELSNLSHMLLIDSNEKIKGWYFDFIRENERWFAIILEDSIHGKGLGSKVLKLAKQKENVLNGWVIDHNNAKRKNGTTYNSPLNFYIKNSFKIVPQKRLESTKISAVKIRWEKEN